MHQNYQTFYRHRSYSKHRSYTIHGNTITPADGECFTEDNIEEALKAFKRIAKPQQKGDKKDQNKKRKNLTHKL